MSRDQLIISGIAAATIIILALLSLYAHKARMQVGDRLASSHASVWASLQPPESGKLFRYVFKGEYVSLHDWELARLIGRARNLTITAGIATLLGALAAGALAWKGVDIELFDLF